MIEENEMLLFIRHLYTLVKECKKCDDNEVKNKIADEINFFSELLERK